ncbi:hypothetical protein OG946_21740 [Streptomyces sp. NBC_01808]|uniref:effector-associated constant component EACC1 n=1 Tax=Streptomyces sp. NBC_01808 TaxID=2975947 RepID=UPI002DD97F4D|nr:hypothetical protein [Streptomyces sp. NBC_01808]WSA39760.1 hypothetical protein OG946_21740 [Streptomyces sp. NBC_01808]
MVIRVRMDGAGAEDELRSLRTWLEAEPEVSRHAAMSWATPPTQPGHMGPEVMEWLQLVTDTAWNAANFVLAYAAWRRTRHDKPTVTVEYDGARVTINDAEPETVAALIRTLSRG